MNYCFGGAIEVELNSSSYWCPHGGSIVIQSFQVRINPLVEPVLLVHVFVLIVPLFKMCLMWSCMLRIKPTGVCLNSDWAPLHVSISAPTCVFTGVFICLSAAWGFGRMDYFIPSGIQRGQPSVRCRGERGLCCLPDECQRCLRK